MAAIGPCQAAILALTNVTGGMFDRVDNAGALYALLDAQNRNVGETPDPTSGRNDGFVTREAGTNLPIVKIKTYQRKNGRSRTVASCDADPVSPTEEVFKITMYREVSVRIPWIYMSSLCGDAAKVLNGGTASGQYRVKNTPILNDVHAQIMSVVLPFISDINNDILGKLSLGAGRNRRTGLTTAKNYTMFDAIGEKRSDGYNEFTTDYKYMGLGGVPIILGGAMANKFNTSMGWGDLAASGTNYAKIMQQTPYRFYLDVASDTTLGQDQFLAMAPGAAKLVTYNQNGGIFSTTWGTGEFGQFTIPQFGDDLRFDLHVEKVSCPQPHADFIVSLYYDVYVPKNVFEAGDPNEGVNGLFKGKAVQAA